jgi:molybdenum cofactor synthesis protein 3
VDVINRIATGERYQRQLQLPEIGPEGQRRLSQSSVAVIGAGGLGAPLLYYLTATGVGNIAIVDNDVVSPSNLQRQILYQESDLGSCKATIAKQRLKALNSEPHIIAITERLQENNIESLLADYQIIIDATDNYPTRYLLDDYTLSTAKALVHGAIEGWSGQSSVFTPFSNLRYRDIYSKRADTSCGVAPGVIGVTAGVIGSIQAGQAIQLCLGQQPSLFGKLLSVDLWRGEWIILDL